MKTFRVMTKAKEFDRIRWEAYCGCEPWDAPPDAKRVAHKETITLRGPYGGKKQRTYIHHVSTPGYDPIYRQVMFNGMRCDLFADSTGVYVMGWDYDKDEDIIWELKKYFLTQAEARRYIERLPSKMNTLDLTRRRFKRM